MLAPVTHILPLTSLRRERLLPSPGRLIARLDQKVNAGDVIAETVIGQEHVLYDIARSMGITPQMAEPLVQLKVGEHVVKNQIIAQRIGLVPQIFRSACDGRVVAVGGGQVMLETGQGTVELLAGLPGVVTRLVADRGAEIMFNGALVQGVWGNGRLETGLMLPVLGQPDEVLPAGRVDVSLRGSVILAGLCNDPAVFQAGAELPIRGLILASMSTAMIPYAMQVRYPVLVIDGFGPLPMNGAAYKLLTTNSKRETTVNAQPYDRHSGARPEIYIPLPTTQEPAAPRDVDTFAPNQQVRLCRAPHLGQVGTLLNLRPGLTSMPSGVRVPAAEVKLENGDQVLVPLANLEVIG